MANKYCNLDGAQKISVEYPKINIGFDKVDIDVSSIITGQDLDPNKDIELLNARGGLPTLGDRISNIEAVKADLDHVDDQIWLINNKVDNIGDGSPKGTYATLLALQTAYPTGAIGIYIVAADGKWYYWNGTGWLAGGTYQATGIANKSISPLKTDFYSFSKNILNKDTALKGYILSSGNTLVNAEFDTSDFIELEINSSYTLQKCYRINFYDDAKVYKLNTNLSNTTTTIVNLYKYCKVTWNNINTELAQMEPGTVATAYESNFAKAYESNNSLTAKEPIVFDDIFHLKSIMTEVGAIVSSLAGYYVTKPIKLLKGQTLDVDVFNAIGNVALLTKWFINNNVITLDKVLVLGDGITTHINYTATEDIEYIRLCSKNDAQNVLNSISIKTNLPIIDVYDQSLNTTDSVHFAEVTTNGTLPTGTLVSPPIGLVSGDVWADTTDSIAYPILRVMI